MKNNAAFLINPGTNKKFFCLIASLVPIIAWSFIMYGWRALRLELTAVLTCVILHLIISSVYIYMKKKRTLFDLSPVITGLLLSLSLPTGVRYPTLIAGAAVAIAVKELFGGLGRNPVNPALAGRMFISVFFHAQTECQTGAVESALSSVLAGKLPDYEVSQLFFGRYDGNIGEISALLIILGALFLIFTGTVSWQTPLSFTACAAALAMLLAPSNVSYYRFTASEIMAGGILFACVYFCSDPVTTPQTKSGKLIFGALAGALTVLVRIYFGYEAVYAVVLVLGLWSPFIDRFVRPGVFGGLKKSASLPPRQDSDGKNAGQDKQCKREKPEI